MERRQNDVISQSDLFRDLATRHKSTAGVNVETVDPEIVANDLEALASFGFVIIENLVSTEMADSLQECLADAFNPTGRNNFEGYKTQRLYSMLGKTRRFDPLVEHPRILAVLDALLMPNYLVSMAQAIKIHPGESAQPLHHDDAFYPMPRPRKALSLATIWALDEFTATNGATAAVPKSHLTADNEPAMAEAIPIVMPKGSVVLFLGTLWHGGGENRSQATRTAFTAQYCEPWLRTQENMSLAVTADQARECSEPLQRMLGYSIHPPFVGQVNGMSPLRVLEGK
jgi:hypothetical protein